MLTTDRDELLACIRDHIVTVLLPDGSDLDLAPDTPLLEWGILNSLSTVRLLNYLRQDLGAPLTSADMVGDNFRNLDSLVSLVLTAAASRRAG